MIPYLGCEVAREMLQAFVDNELPVADQVALESHLRWCQTCAAHVHDLQVIGESLRIAAPADDRRELAGLQSGVLSRLRAEHAQSFGVQVRSLFDDFHLLWAGLGASAALLVCLFGTMSVLHAANEEHPESLAGVIHSLANPGSNSNPARLDSRILGPRPLENSAMVPLDHLREDEAAFALVAVVTREGRIANYELLQSVRDGARRRDAAAQAGDMSPLLDAVKRSRFMPAQRVEGTPVAVNLVWLLARTTVKAPLRAMQLESHSEPAGPAEPAVVVPAKPIEQPQDLARPISERPFRFLGVATV